MGLPDASVKLGKFVRAAVSLGLSFCLAVSNAPLSAAVLPPADFSAAAKPENPLDIVFTDKSPDDIVQWKWNFGDGSVPLIISYEQKSGGTLVSTSLEVSATSLDISGDVIIARTQEVEVEKDLDGDGMIRDPILQYYNMSSRTLVNTRSVARNRGPKVHGNTIAFVSKHYVLAHHDINSNRTFVTAADTGMDSNPAVFGNVISFVTSEFFTGDTNGDGDSSDWAVRYFDKTTGRISGTGGTSMDPTKDLTMANNIIAFPTYEPRYGRDLNSDGDQADVVAMYFAIAQNKLISTKGEMVGALLSAFGNKIAFISHEKNVGTGTDLNGDGDQNDLVLRYFDISTGNIINTGGVFKLVNALSQISMSQYLIAFTSEDGILAYYDFSTGRIINTGAKIFTNPSVNEKKIAFLAKESDIGNQGEDLNGDGDKTDVVLRYLDASTGRVYDTGAEGSGMNVSISGNTIAFLTGESQIGPVGLDLNENGNIQEEILRYFLIDDHSQFNGSTSHLYEKPGTYTVTLAVTATNGQTSSVAKNIETAPIDTQPPLVQIIQPLDNSTVKDAITIEVQVSDSD